MNLNFKLSTIRTFIVGMVFLVACQASFAGNPIPGLDVKLGKNPGGIIAVVSTTDANGRFSFKVVDPGQYTLSIGCKRLGLDMCPPLKIAINATGTVLKPGAASPSAYDFFVDKRLPAVISGVISDNADKANYLNDESEDFNISSEFDDTLVD